MNNPNMIKELCEKYNVRLTYKPYRMWHSVPYIHKTALVVDEYVQGGGHRIIMDPRHFPMEITEELIKEAIEHNAYSLGRLIYKGVNANRRTFIPWDQLVGNYPPGYFTNRIGIGVSGN